MREPFERYRVAGRKQEVDFIARAFESSGATVLEAPDPSSAPFHFTVRDAGGAALQVLCYAFSANRYRQGGRPAGEHRFQIKYGSDFRRYHHLYIPADRTADITLMFGVHFELELFIAVDPTMNNPTWFSKSVEFKQADLDIALRHGWHGWERERSPGRRKQEMPSLNFQTEVLIGFRPEHLLTYAKFERRWQGMDPGERLLSSDLLEEVIGQRTAVALRAHPLESKFQMSAHRILDVIGEHSRLETAVRGGVAESHLIESLKGVPELTDVVPIDLDGQPDASVVYHGRPFRIECKNVLRRTPKGETRVDFQRTRASKVDPCSRYYRPGEFDVLAACLHPVTQQWEFKFCPTFALSPHRVCAGRLSERVTVLGPDWSDDLPAVLERVARGL